MKILHLNDHYEKVGGAEILLFRALEALEKAGVSNVIIHQHPAAASDERRTYQVPELGKVSLSPHRKMLETLRQIVDREHPDVIHVHDIGNPDVIELCGRLRPTVQSVLNHSFYCPGGLKYLPRLGRVCKRPFGLGCIASAFLTGCNSIRPKILAASYRRSQRMLRSPRHPLFVTLSHYQARQLEANGIPPDRIRVLPPFTELPPEEAIGSRSSEPLLLFTGRAFPGKGLPVLIRALRHLNEPFRLVVDSDGPELAHSKKLAQRLGLSHSIDFTGWSSPSEHAGHYRDSRVVVIPSVWPEPFGLVGIEAMSYAKPVVAFRVGAIPDWLEDGETGFLIEPYDEDLLAGKIKFLLTHPSQAAEMGQKGRRRVQRLFSEEIYMANLLKIYKQVLSSKHGPG